MFFVKLNGRVISEHISEEAARISRDALGSVADAAAIVTGPPLQPMSGVPGRCCAHGSRRVDPPHDDYYAGSVTKDEPNQFIPRAIDAYPAVPSVDTFHSMSRWNPTAQRWETFDTTAGRYVPDPSAAQAHAAITSAHLG